ncbi:MAG TPA: hypothetical protein VF544_08635 [Pyrinomonadaceae bacterium]
MAWRSANPALYRCKKPRRVMQLSALYDMVLARRETTHAPRRRSRPSPASYAKLALGRTPDATCGPKTRAAEDG